MDFVSLRTRKSEQKAWRVLQNHVFLLLVIKSTCEAISDVRAHLEAILGSGEAWEVPSEGTLVKQRN